MQKKYLNWILLISVSFIWGSPFILRLKALQTYSAFQIAAFQVFIAFLFFTPFIVKHIKSIDYKNWRFLILNAVLGNVMPSILFALAQTKITSSMAGVLSALTPTMTLFISILFYKLKPNKYTLLGLFAGFLGTALLAISDGFDNNSRIIGIILVCLSVMSIGLSINIVRFNLSKLTGIQVAALSFLFIGPIAGSYLAYSFVGKTELLAHTSIAFVALLAFTTFIGVMLFNNLIKYSGPVFASSIAYLIPIFALFWGIVLGKESIELKELSYFALIILGIVLINKYNKNH